jgi:hypothetical protein
VVAGAGQGAEAGSVEGQHPDQGTTGCHRCHPSAERGGQRLLAVRGDRQAAGDTGRDAERPKRCRGSPRGVHVSLVERASPLPLQDVADSEPDRDGHRCRPEPVPGPATAPQSEERVLSPDQQRPAQAGHGKPPADLPDRAAEHRLAWPGGKCLLDGQTQRDRRQVGHEREPTLRPPASSATAATGHAGDDLRGTGLQSVLGPDREEVVQTGRQGGDDALVDG